MTASTIKKGNFQFERLKKVLFKLLKKGLEKKRPKTTTVPVEDLETRLLQMMASSQADLNLPLTIRGAMLLSPEAAQYLLGL